MYSLLFLIFYCHVRLDRLLFTIMSTALASKKMYSLVYYKQNVTIFRLSNLCILKAVVCPLSIFFMLYIVKREVLIAGHHPSILLVGPPLCVTATYVPGNVLLTTPAHTV